MTEGSQPYNLRTLRKLIISAFDTEELRALVRYDDTLSGLAAQFAPVDSITTMVDKTISWCDRRALLPYLVQLVEQKRPGTFRAFEPEPIPTASDQPAEEAAVESTAEQVFICYARQDEGFVLRLAGALKGQGVPVWIDQWDIPGSADWDITIEEALARSSHMVVVLSPAAMKSEEVRGEWRAAVQAGKPIVPVLFQACTIHRRLQLIQHIDFTSRPPTDATAVGEIVIALGMGESTREEARPAILSAKPEPVLINGQARSPGTGPITLELVRVPAGEFSMGSVAAKDPYAEDDEFPPHQVYVPAFHIGQYPVTNLQYEAFIWATGYQMPRHWEHLGMPLGKGNHPVFEVSWRDALAFCTWLGEETGQPFRLPTEAEWEKAARGTDGRIWPWGDEPPGASSNLGDQVGDNTPIVGHDPTPIGRYSPQGDSPYGCADMAGNVWEWCQSLYRPYPYRAGDGREDLQADGPRVVRGGPFWRDHAVLRCAFRIYIDPDDSHDYYGFRVVRGPLEGAP